MKRLARKKGNTLGTLQTINAGKERRESNAGKLLDESLDSFDEELLRVDRDYSEKILDEDLTLEQRIKNDGQGDESQRLNSGERDPKEDKSGD
jgi:hypothetical protein